MNKEFTRMLKLAGLMTEGLYTSDEKAPMEAMSHDGESKMTKKSIKGKDQRDDAFGRDS
jgi:alpha-galactosidase